FWAATRAPPRGGADRGFDADLVLSVARGGLTVGGALAYALSVKNCATINVEFYTGVDERLPVPVGMPPVRPSPCRCRWCCHRCSTPSTSPGSRSSSPTTWPTAAGPSSWCAAP